MCLCESADWIIKENYKVAMKNDCAFPMMPSHTNPKDVDQCFKGLTKREYFAGLVMQSLTRLIPSDPTITPRESIEIARKSLMIANDLIAELERDHSNNEPKEME